MSFKWAELQRKAAATRTVKSRAESPVKGSEHLLHGGNWQGIWALQVNVELKHNSSNQLEYDLLQDLHVCTEDHLRQSLKWTSRPKVGREVAEERWAKQKDVDFCRF